MEALDKVREGFSGTWDCMEGAEMSGKTTQRGKMSGTQSAIVSAGIKIIGKTGDVP